MADDTLTISFGGDVPLDVFVTGLQAFGQLVDALSKELSPDDVIEWTIAGLDYGSAEATARGTARSEKADPVLRVIRGYADVGRALESGHDVPFPLPVSRPAVRLARIPDTKVTVVRFITEEGAQEVLPAPLLQVARSLHRAAYGAIEGRVQTLSEHRGLKFVLYDGRDGLPVHCYVREGHRETLRGIWGRRVLVEGWVTRDRVSGRPITINQIETIDPLPEREPGEFRLVRGILPQMVGEPPPEQRVRALRDAD